MPDVRVTVVDLGDGVTAEQVGVQVTVAEGVSGAGGGGVTDHGALTGLADDDHTQYALANGTRGTFATAAQGALADTATQPADLGDSAALDVGATAGTVAAGDHTHSGVYANASHAHALANVTDAGDSAGLDVGTTAGTVAAGDHDHDGDYLATTAEILAVDVLTESEYAALDPKVATTFYIVVADA